MVTTNFEYYKKQCLQDIVNTKKSIENKLYALKSITRKSKKDKSDFKNLIQNFSTKDDKVYISYSRYDFLDDLCFWYNWYEVTISYTDNNTEKYDESRRVTWRYWWKKVILNIDEIFDKINDLIKYYTDELEKTNKAIENYEKTTSDLEKMINNILEYIKGKDEAYKLKEFVKNVIYHSYDY